MFRRRITLLIVHEASLSFFQIITHESSSDNMSSKYTTLESLFSRSARPVFADILKYKSYSTCTQQMCFFLFERVTHIYECRCSHAATFELIYLLNSALVNSNKSQV